tara:strand:+ start:40954 stop:41190 length:237 start_codon:yes stop_codon:yes gene_type:complete
MDFGAGFKNGVLYQFYIERGESIALKMHQARPSECGILGIICVKTETYKSHQIKSNFKISVIFTKKPLDFTGLPKLFY